AIFIERKQSKKKLLLGITFNIYYSKPLYTMYASFDLTIIYYTSCYPFLSITQRNQQIHTIVKYMFYMIERIYLREPNKIENPNNMVLVKLLEKYCIAKQALMLGLYHLLIQIYMYGQYLSCHICCQYDINILYRSIYAGLYRTCYIILILFLFFSFL
ncbi:hypothetical protein ACJX0J_027588, partial [Zea mays]